MTLEEKISICSGASFWYTKAFEKYEIPAIMVTDGPHGLRKQNETADMLGVNDSIPSTCFPSAVTMGASWNKELLSQVATTIGTEALHENVSVVLGPGINIKRNPLCGRNFEYFSEDPYLTGELGTAFVKGMQDNTGIGTSLKHFACNSQEYKRFSSDSIIDERTMREIYLAGFEKTIKQPQPKTVMCAYNKINGVYCSDNKKLLTDILRTEWGFKGLVVTDWGATSNKIEAFKAGCDLSMPGGTAYMEKDAKDAVKKGLLQESDIDACVERVLELCFTQTETLKNKSITSIDADKHHLIAKKIATEGIVLLKNKDTLLPISSNKKIALFGDMAKNIRYQGSGSSHIQPTKLDNLLECFEDAIFEQGCNTKGEITETELQRVSKIAAEVDVAVVCVGLTDFYESESFDRETLDIPDGHNKMVEAISKANPNTVVVLMGGSVMTLPWEENVKSIIYTGLPGQAGAGAITDILLGTENPSGKLTESWPESLQDVPSNGFYAYDKKNAEYRESIYIGYRYYQKAKKSVKYPFGFGLSYTTFKYSNLTVKNSNNENTWTVTVDVTNTGNYDGAEVVQLYIGNPQDGIHRPVQELKGFAKTFLKKGETKTVEFQLNDRSFSVYDNGWKIPTGKYSVLIGSSSENIILEESLEITGEKINIPDWQKNSWYETPVGQPQKTEWEKLLGHSVKDDELVKGKFTLSNTLLELEDHCKIAKLLCNGMKKQLKKSMKIEDEDNPQYKMNINCTLDCSLQGFSILSAGIFPLKTAKAIVQMANGHTFKGILEFLKR